MKLILTRHGETIDNVAKIIQGHRPGKLSKNGIEQAKKVAERLKDEKIDYIYSSDLARAADTAREIAKYHPDTPIEFVEELRERRLGEFQGKKREEVNWPNDPEILKKMGVETKDEMCLRSEKLLHRVLSQHKDDNVLFVCHNGIGKALICVITGKKPKEINSFEKLKNTSVNIFNIYGDKENEIHCFNCTKHLD